MRQLLAARTRAQVAAVVVAVLLVVGMLLLNLRVDRLWASFPERSGPCLAQEEAACRYGFVN